MSANGRTYDPAKITLTLAGCDIIGPVQFVYLGSWTGRYWQRRRTSQDRPRKVSARERKRSNLARKHAWRRQIDRVAQGAVIALSVWSFLNAAPYHPVDVSARGRLIEIMTPAPPIVVTVNVSA